MILGIGLRSVQDVKKGIIGRRVAAEVGNQVVRGTVKSLAGSTRGGLGIYLVALDGRGGVQPFARDMFAVEHMPDDWGLVCDD